METAMKALVGVLVLAGLLYGQAHANEHQGIGGVPRVLDGDTLAFGKQRVRLDGIDAPESSQSCYRERNSAGSAWSCGAAATEALRSYISNRPVSCEVLDTDRYGRLIARCSVLHDGQSVDLGGAMVWNGWALAYTQYSRAYVREQREAEAAGRGIWTSHWQSPDEYRRQASR